VLRHIAFLSRVLMLWAAFNAIIGLAVGAFAVAAAALALSSGSERPGTEVAAGVTAASLTLLAVTALAWAIVHLVCARGLTRRRPAARILGLVLGVFNLPLLPLGTGVGAYTLWVLLHDESRREFVE
jgi:hypothetical protein